MVCVNFVFAVASVLATGLTNQLSATSKPYEENSSIEVTGVVRGAFLDDVDERWTMLVLSNDKSPGDTPPLVLSVNQDCLSRDKALELVGAKISARGETLKQAGFRRFFDRYLAVNRPDEITVLVPPGDPFDKPALVITDDIVNTSLLAAMGRVSIVGDVLAVWGKGQLIVKTSKIDYICCTLSDSTAATTFSVGDRVKVVGFPETNLYHINLTQAIVRHEPGKPEAKAEPLPMTPDAILRGTHPTRPHGFQADIHGKLIRMIGKVIDRQSDGLHLSCEGHLVPIRFGSQAKVEDVPLGAIIEATGICIVDCEACRPTMPLPLINGYYLVTRATDDIRILSKPSWWTPGRLLAMIVILCVTLLGIAIWNRILDRLVTRKSNALVRERSAHDLADMRTEERIRLAVDLHDSLSQNLSSISCLVMAADNELAKNPATTARHLTTLKQMLLSCRTELKRCLFDLRGDALDLPDIDAAIRKTVRPVIGEAVLDVRFDVRRSLLPDSTVHAVLCVIRELAANAVRHGNATKIAVCGNTADQILHFSVTDNGSGFDPTNAAGPAEGHFGLTGIRDRIKRLTGTFEIKRTTKGGMVATMTIPLEPRDKP